MSNKGNSNRANAEFNVTGNGTSNIPAIIDSQNISENTVGNLKNPRYSLGGARASLGPVKTGRLSQVTNNEFSDSSKLSLSGRNSFSAHDSRVSLSR